MLKDINELTEERDRLRDIVNELKRKLESVNLENEGKLKQKISELETYIKESHDKFNEEFEAQKKNSENSYAQLKEFYEAEKKRIESRILEEKEKSEKKYRMSVEEYEEKIKQDTENFEEEIANKEQEIRELEEFLNEEIRTLKQQSGLDFQKIQSLESYIKDNKDQLESCQKLNHLALEQCQDKFNNERTLFTEKIEKLLMENSQKERDLSMVNFKKDQAESQLQIKSQELKEAISEIENQKALLSTKLEDLKQANKKLQEDVITNKSDYKREVALNQQEIEFKINRITELENSLRDTEEKYRDALKMLRNEGGQELSAVVENLTTAKEILERKLHEKKKNQKELNSGYSKQISQLEKEKTILNEKLLNMESKCAEIEYKFALERDKMIAQMQDKQNYEDESQNPLFEECEKLKNIIEELQLELSDKNAYIEREKILWDNKFNFLTQQKDSAKADLYDAQRKFQFSLEQLHKRELSGKEKQESSMNSLISSIESRYISQIKDLQETNQSISEQFALKVKLMEQEMTGLKEELEIQRRGKGLFSGNIEQRCKQLQEIEAKLLIEIENLNKQKEEKKNEDIEDSFGFEKDHMKKKLIEMDRRIKEADQQRSQMYLELEKERSR